MNAELYHRRAWAVPKKDHKYTRREWKNGHWVYYYDDGTTTTDYPKGQNYKSVDQVKAEKESQAAATAEKKAREASKQERAQEIDDTFDSLVRRGRQAAKKLNFYLDMPVPDLIEYLKNK